MARESKRDRWARIGGICEREISQAENSGDEIEAVRRKAVEYYRCAPRGDEKADRSQVHSPEIRNMVNSVLAHLVPMQTTDAVVELEPESLEDEEAAALESDALNKLIIEDNRGAIEIQEACKDALMMRNGVMKIWREESRTVDQVKFTGATDEQITAWANDMMMRIPGLTITRTKDGARVERLDVRFRISAVPIENCCWSGGENVELQDRRFFAERLDLSRSALRARGVPADVLAEIGTSSRVPDGPRASVRDWEDGETEDQEIIGCHECYLLIDQDGDGISERWRILIADENTVLEEEQVDLIPYALGTAFINPHRLEGESLADHLFEVQDVKTTLARLLNDNINTHIVGRWIYNPSLVNEQDVMRPRAGGGIRARDISAVSPVPIMDVTSGILAGLAYWDKQRAEGGGASLDMMQADAQIVGETATGIERQYGSRELLVSMMGSNIAQTLIRDLYRVTHAFLRRYADRPMMVRRRGQYVQVDPRQWPERSRLNVTVGMTPGQRSHMQAALSQLISFQATAMQQGLSGQLVSPSTLHACLTTWLRAAGVSNPESLLIDPMSEQAQQAAQAAQQQAQAAQQQQQQQAAILIELETRKLDLEERKNSGELAHKYFETETDMAMKEAELVAGAQVDLEKQAREAAAQSRRDAAAARGGNERAA